MILPMEKWLTADLEFDAGGSAVGITLSGCDNTINIPSKLAVQIVFRDLPLGNGSFRSDIVEVSDLSPRTTGHDLTNFSLEVT